MVQSSPRERVGKESAETRLDAQSELRRDNYSSGQRGDIREVAKNIATRFKNCPLWTWLGDRAPRRGIVQWLLQHALRKAGKKLLDIGQLADVAIHRILVLRPNHRLGNILLLTPLLAELERVFPGAEVDVLIAGNSAGELLEFFPSVRHVHGLPHHMVRHPATTVAMITRLRRTRYDLAVDTSVNSHSSRLVLEVVSPRYRIGVPGRGDATWSRVMVSAPKHFAKLPVFLVRHALAREEGRNGIAYPPLSVRLTSLERKTGREIFQSLTRDSARFHTTLGVFADATGAKCYAGSWWLEFLTAIEVALPNCEVIEFVPADGRSRLSDRFPTYYSTSLRKLASVISNVTCFVSADCGVMHLASATGVPTIGLFSVTDPTRYEPYGEFNRSLQTRYKTPDEIAAIAIGSLG